MINFSHTFHWLFFRHCALVLDILEMCIWIFGEDKISFNMCMAFLVLAILEEALHFRYVICVIKSSHNFSVDVLQTLCAESLTVFSRFFLYF